MPGILMSDTTISKSRFSARKASASTPSRAKPKAIDPSLIDVFQIGLVVDDEDFRLHGGPAAASIKVHPPEVRFAKVRPD
jgi:hypothetical protein